MKSKTIHSIKDTFLLDPDIIFLNHGSFGATPLPVFENYQKWQRILEKQPVEFLGRKAPEYLSTARQSIGNYFNTNKDNLVCVTNATV